VDGTLGLDQLLPHCLMLALNVPNKLAILATLWALTANLS